MSTLQDKYNSSCLLTCHFVFDIKIYIFHKCEFAISHLSCVCVSALVDGRCRRVSRGEKSIFKDQPVHMDNIHKIALNSGHLYHQLVIIIFAIQVEIHILISLKLIHYWCRTSISNWWIRYLTEVHHSNFATHTCTHRDGPMCLFITLKPYNRLLLHIRCSSFSTSTHPFIIFAILFNGPSKPGKNTNFDHCYRHDISNM